MTFTYNKPLPKLNFQNVAEPEARWLDGKGKYCRWKSIVAQRKLKISSKPPLP